MQIFDTHCHYNLSPLYEDWSTHWQKAQEAGLVGSVVAGTNIETSRRAVEINRREPLLLAAIGVHPNEYDKLSPADLPTTLMAQQSVLTQLIKNGRVSAIGETGLDYFRVDEDRRAIVLHNQQQAFRIHIQLANDHRLPLIVHVRDKADQAYWDVLELLKKEYQWLRPCVLHCVSGPQKYIDEAVKLGAYIGVAGNVTYPKAETLRNLVMSVPADRVLSETDAPYLPPQSHRGQTCEPWLVSQTVAYLQQELNIDPQQLLHNAQAVFTSK